MFIVFEFDLESVTKHTVLLFMQHHSKCETHLLIVEFFITLIVFLHFKNILYIHDYTSRIVYTILLLDIHIKQGQSFK